MKTRELMLGDWVKDKYKPKPHQVDSWADFNSSEDLSPITLTPEILEQNGMFLLTEQNYVRCVIADYNKFGKFNKCELHYVHELQHALRIFGLNELADNFKI